MSFIPYLIHIPLIIFFVFLVRKKYTSDILSEYYYPALILKISVGISLGLIYIFYYNGNSDSVSFFEISGRLASLFLTDPFTFLKIYFLNTPYPLCDGCSQDGVFGISIEGDPRTLFYVKLLAVFNLITFNSYWLTSVYLSFFSFLGFYFLSNALVKIYHISKVSVGFSLLFFPSVLVWSSGVLKESFVMGALTFMVSIVLLWLHKIEKVKFQYVFVLLISAIVIFEIKYYYFAILIPVLIAYSMVKLIQEHYQKVSKSEWLQVILFFMFFVIITLMVSRLHPNLSFDYFSEALINSYHAILKESQGKNVYYFNGIEPGFTNILKFMPEALSIGLFRPFIWETHNVLGFITALENLVILILFISTLIKLFSDLINKKPVIPGLGFISLTVYVLLLAFIIPIASANWGSLVRYKIGYFPFLILLISIKNPIMVYISKKLYGIDSR
jgi:hypothetical protein